MYAARRANLERALAGEDVSYEVEFPRQGGVAFTEVVHVPHRDARGEVLGVYVIVTDVTQHKLAERAIAESEARFRAIANSAPVLIWVTGRRRPRGNSSIRPTSTTLAGATRRRSSSTGARPSIPTTCRAFSKRRRPSSPRPGWSRSRPAFAAATGRGAGCRAESQPRWTVAGEHAGFIGVAHDVTAAEAGAGRARRDQRDARTPRRGAHRRARSERSAGDDVLPALARVPRRACRGRRRLPLSGDQSGDACALRQDARQR